MAEKKRKKPGPVKGARAPRPLYPVRLTTPISEAQRTKLKGMAEKDGVSASEVVRWLIDAAPA